MPRIAVLVLLAGIAATLLGAQQLPPGVQAPPATADKESFQIQPRNLSAGAKDQALRLVCNTAAGFNTSSSRPPQLKFSAGATLRASSFHLLSANEAECRVDIADDAFGTVDVSLELYSVNGTAVASTLRATLGVIGQAAVPQSQAKVGAESVELVRVNHSSPQKAGAILLTGSIAGSVSITAPTGTMFSKQPVATTSAGTVNSPALASNNTVFTFSIGNAGLDDVTVRVGDIEYNTQLFGLGGGVNGALACEVTGAALSNQTTLVVNAFTARTTLQGTNDNTTPAAGGSQGTNSQTGNSTTTPKTPAGSVNTQPSSQGRNLENAQRDRQQRNRDTQPATGGAVGGGPVAGTAPAPARAPIAPPPQQLAPQNQGGAQPQPQPAAPGGAAPVAGGSPATRNAADGSMRPAPEQPQPRPEPGTTGTGLDIRREAPAMQVSPGLYFCDRDFKPLGAVVLDKTVAGEAGGRVWIVFRRAKDKDPTKVETVTVTLKVCGVARELILTETGKDTGEFRCGREGVLLLAAENPDSNTVDAPAEPAKIRLPR